MAEWPQPCGPLYQPLKLSLTESTDNQIQALEIQAHSEGESEQQLVSYVLDQAGGAWAPSREGAGERAVVTGMLCHVRPSVIGD